MEYIDDIPTYSPERSSVNVCSVQTSSTPKTSKSLNEANDKLSIATTLNDDYCLFCHLSPNNNLVNDTLLPWDVKDIEEVVFGNRRSTYFSHFNVSPSNNCPKTTDWFNNRSCRRIFAHRVSHLLYHCWIRFTDILRRLSSRFNKCTKLEVFFALKIYLPASYLRENCVIACSKALNLYTDSNDNFKLSKSQRAGIVFDVGKFHRWLVDNKVAGFIKEFASVYAAALMESLCEEMSLLLLLCDPGFVKATKLIEIFANLLGTKLAAEPSQNNNYFFTEDNNYNNQDRNQYTVSLLDIIFEKFYWETGDTKACLMQCWQQPLVDADGMVWKGFIRFVCDICVHLITCLVRGTPILTYVNESATYSFINNVEKILSGQITLKIILEDKNTFRTHNLGDFAKSSSRQICPSSFAQCNNYNNVQRMGTSSLLLGNLSAPINNINNNNNNYNNGHSNQSYGGIRTNGSIILTPLDETLGSEVVNDFNLTFDGIIEATSFIWVNPNFHGFPRHNYYNIINHMTPDCNSNPLTNQQQQTYSDALLDGLGQENLDLLDALTSNIRHARSYVFARCPHKIPIWSRDAFRTYFNFIRRLNDSSVTSHKNDQQESNRISEMIVKKCRRCPDHYNWLHVIVSLLEHRDSVTILPEDVYQAASILLPQSTIYFSFPSLLNFYQELLISSYMSHDIGNQINPSSNLTSIGTNNNFDNSLYSSLLLNPNDSAFSVRNNQSFVRSNNGNNLGAGEEDASSIIDRHAANLLEVRCKQSVAFQMLSSGNANLVPLILKLLSIHSTTYFSPNQANNLAINSNILDQRNLFLNNNHNGAGSAFYRTNSSSCSSANRNGLSSNGANINNLTINIIDEDELIEQQTLITPLMYSCIDRNYVMAKALLAHGVDIDKDVIMINASCCSHLPSYYIEICHWTALSFAVIFGHRDLVELLLQNGANVEGGIKCGEELCFSETPLQLACASGNNDIVNQLLNKGGDPYLCTAYNHRSSCCLPPSPSPTAVVPLNNNNTNLQISRTHYHNHHHNHHQHVIPHRHNHYRLNLNQYRHSAGTHCSNVSAATMNNNLNNFNRPLPADNLLINGMDLAVRSNLIGTNFASQLNRSNLGSTIYENHNNYNLFNSHASYINAPSFLDFISNPSALCNNNLNTLPGFLEAAAGAVNGNNQHGSSIINNQTNNYNTYPYYQNINDSTHGIRAGSHAPFVIAASHGRLDIVRAMLAQPHMPKPRDILSLEEILAEGCSSMLPNQLLHNSSSIAGTSPGTRSVSSKCPSPSPSALSNSSYRNSTITDEPTGQQQLFFNFPNLSNSNTLLQPNTANCCSINSVASSLKGISNLQTTFTLKVNEISTDNNDKIEDQASSISNSTNVLPANNTMEVKSTFQHIPTTRLALTQSKSLNLPNNSLQQNTQITTTTLSQSEPSSFSSVSASTISTTNNNNEIPSAPPSIAIKSSSLKEPKNRRHSQPKLISKKLLAAPNLNSLFGNKDCTGTSNLTTNLSNLYASSKSAFASGKTSEDYLTLQEILAEGYIMPPPALQSNTSNQRSSTVAEGCKTSKQLCFNSASTSSQLFNLPEQSELDLLDGFDNTTSLSYEISVAGETNNGTCLLNNQDNNTVNVISSIPSAGSNLFNLVVANPTTTTNTKHRSNSTKNSMHPPIKNLTKAQARVLIEAMYHAAESGHVQICLEFRKLGIMWNLHIWIKCLNYMIPETNESYQSLENTEYAFIDGQHVDLRSLLYLLNDFSNVKFEELNLNEYLDAAFPILIHLFKMTLNSMDTDKLNNSSTFFPSPTTDDQGGDIASTSKDLSSLKIKSEKSSPRKLNLRQKIFVAVCKILSTCYTAGVRCLNDEPVILPSPIPNSFQSVRSSLIDPCYVNSPDLSDISFLVEGKIFYGHKIILVNSSPRFKAMLCDKFVECHQDIIPIPDIRYDIFKVIMEFLYSGKVDSIKSRDGDFVMELMAASNFFLLDGLQRECEIFSSNILNISNCVSIYKTAKLYNCEELISYCVGYFLKHLPELVERNPDGSFLEIFWPESEYSMELYKRIKSLINIRFNNNNNRINK